MLPPPSFSSPAMKQATLPATSSTSTAACIWRNLQRTDLMADYREAWEAYRHRRNRFFLVAFSILPARLLFRGMTLVVHDEAVLSAVGGILILSWFFGPSSRPSKRSIVRVRAS